MRILASNPDTIGDMVLRQPMYRALREAGHELTLVVRASVAPLVPYVAPGADVLVLPGEVYRDDLDSHWGLFEDLFGAARRVAPDALLVAPFRWTRFEERLADELAEGRPRRFGMSGGIYAGDPAAGRQPPSQLRFDVTATVGPDEPEVKKNAALAAAVLGVPVESLGAMEPVIEADAAGLDEARQTLARLGLEPDGYWVACVTGTVNVPIKSWQLEHWARVLSQWSVRHGRRFLFTGLAVEREAVEQVRGLMDRDAAERSAVWMEEGGTLGQLIALTALSRGYAGHDTGPMHIAAALGKPVLGVFGGGTWPRFVPAGRAASVVVTVGVACAGCGWSCPFQASHCIKAVGVDDVSRAADDLETGRVAGHELRVLDAGEALRDRMVREAAGFAWERQRDAGDRVRELRRQRELTIVPLQSALEQRVRQAAALNASVAQLTSGSANLAGRLKQKEDEAARLSAEWVLRTREAEELRQSVVARDQAADRLGKQVRELELAAATAAAGSPARRPKTPWRQRAVDLVTGKRQFVPRRSAWPLPKIALVTPIPAGLACDCPDCGKGTARSEESRPPARPCRSADILAVRQTIESVLAQDYPRLEYIIAPAGKRPDGAAPSWLEAYAGRLSVRTEVAGGPFDAIARAFDSSDADVIGWLDPGDVLEPGAMQNVGEFFRDHPRSAGAVFDDTAEVGPWRMVRPRPRMDVRTLLSDAASHEHASACHPIRRLRASSERSEGSLPPATTEEILRLAQDDGLKPSLHVQSSTGGGNSGAPAGDGASASIFVRRQAYRAIGRFNVLRDRATGRDFCLRFSRRYGFARPGAHVACRRPRPTGSALVPLHVWPAPGRPPEEAIADWRRDAAAARQAFESAFGFAGRVRTRLVHHGLRLGDSLRRLAGRDRLVFAPSPMTRPAAVAPPDECRQAAGGEPCAVAHDTSISPVTERPPVRLIFGPPVADGTRPCPIYHDPGADVAFTFGAAAPAPAAQASPFIEHRPAHVWERRLVRLPCLRARLASTSNPANPSVRLLSVLSRLTSSSDLRLRFLHAGAGDGQLLRQLRPIVRWLLDGTESDPKQASAARGPGMEIWEADPFDAASVLPVGRSFDVILLDQRAVRGGDLVATLRRLRQLLRAGGRIVLTGPNLDSRLLDLFGPTWPGWRIDRPLTIPGRRGAGRLARMADLRLTRFRTFTDTAACVTAVQQSRLRQVASSPSEPPSEEDRRRGRRLTAWANLLWDWRGRGDAFYAVME